MSCDVCGREADAWEYRQPGPNPFKEHRPFVRGCSRTCIEVLRLNYERLEGMELGKLEVKAVDLAMEAVGEAIEATGTTDLAKMTQEQFATIIGTAFTTVAAEVKRMADENAVPF